jgi:hypothetical protein
VLLVHNDHAETVELHLVIEQGMRADEQRYLPLRNAFQELLAVFTFHGTGQQGYLQVERAQQSAERGQMLLRQNFGRSHEGCLEAIGDRHEHR